MEGCKTEGRRTEGCKTEGRRTEGRVLMARNLPSTKL